MQISKDPLPKDFLPEARELIRDLLQGHLVQLSRLHIVDVEMKRAGDEERELTESLIKYYEHTT